MTRWKWTLTDRSLFLTMALPLSFMLLQASSAWSAERTEESNIGETPALEEVVVTAEFRETRLQETPIAITAVTADMIEARGITDLVQIAAAAPNVSLRKANAAYGNTLQAYIRGIGQLDFNYAFEPGVGIYIDDVYHGTAFGAVVDLYDLERVEVLRGPQGTLFGKNSIGGAIRMVSKKPQGDNSGFVELTYGNYDTVIFRGAFDVPLVKDRLALRVSATSDNRDGYQDRIDFACDRPGLAGSIPSEAGASAANGCKVGAFGGKDVQAIRAALRWTPDERWDINLAVDFMDDDSEAQANKLLAIGDGAGNYNTVPGTSTGLPFLIGTLWNPNENLPNFGVPFDARFLDPDPFRTYGTYRDLLRGFDTGRVSTVESTGYSLIVDFAISDGLAFKSITAWRSYDGVFSHDPDQSPLALQNVQNIVGNDQFTQELRLSGETGDQKLFYTIGGFYLDSESTLQGLVNIPPIPGSFYGSLGFYQDDVITTKNKSVFAHAEYMLTDRLQGFGGLRYTDEEKRYHFDHTPELTIQDPGGKPFKRTDWRIGIEFRASENTMAYGSVTTGFRSGGVNPRPFTDAQFIPFGPEDITSFELGVKLDFYDHRARLNLAGFISDFDHRIQRQQTVDAEGAPLTAPTNLGTGRIRGFEAELEANPTEHLVLNAQVGYAKFTSSDTAYAGERPIATPDWTANAGAQYEIVLAGGSAINLRLDWYYQSRVDFALDSDPLVSTPARSLWNGMAAWDVSEKWTLSLHGYNLADKRYYVNKFTLMPFGLATLEGQPGHPREWRISAMYRF